LEKLDQEDNSIFGETEPGDNSIFWGTEPGDNSISWGTEPGDNSIFWGTESRKIILYLGKLNQEDWDLYRVQYDHPVQCTLH